jgi:hypothetical protein
MGLSVEDALAGIPGDYHDDCRAIDLEAIPPLRDLQTEVAIAWNPWIGKSRILGHHIGRDYVEHGLDVGNEYPGTADRFGYITEGEYEGWPCVDDYKTGEARTVDPAEDNWQMKQLGVAWAAHLGVSRIIVRIIRTKGTVRVDQAVFEAMDLANAAFDLKMLAQTIKDGTGELVEGSHCRWCPSFDYCPKKKDTLMSLVKKPELTIEAIMQAIQSDPKGAYLRWRQVKNIVRKLDAAIVAHAEKEPIQLGNGVVYGRHEFEESNIDPEVAWNELKAAYGEDVAKSAMTLRTSKAGIERALGPVSPRGKKKATLEAMLKHLEANGGLRKQKASKVEEYSPKASEAVIDAD